MGGSTYILNFDNRLKFHGARLKLQWEPEIAFSVRCWSIYTVYRVIQEEKPISSEIIESVIVIKNVHMIMCLILNGYNTELFESTIANGKKAREIICC